jgi:hypothetical protein
MDRPHNTKLTESNSGSRGTVEFSSGTQIRVTELPHKLIGHKPDRVGRTWIELAASCKDPALNYTNRMPETIDLAKALGRWDNEGGASALSPEADLGPDLAFHAVEERVLRFLGAAVIMQWNDLPTEIQRKLFDDAASMSDSARQFELKQQIARFLHEHKDDE